MCEIIEKYKAEGRAEGKAEGKAEGRIQAVKDMIKAGLTTLTDVKKSGLYTEAELAAIIAP